VKHSELGINYTAYFILVGIYATSAVDALSVHLGVLLGASADGSMRKRVEDRRSCE
jgi:hypothetical protein